VKNFQNLDWKNLALDPKKIRHPWHVLYSQHNGIFHFEDDILTFTNTAMHEIKLKQNKPPNRRSYRLPFAQKAETDSQIQNMSDKDIIEKYVSPWFYPYLVVKKKAEKNSSG